MNTAELQRAIEQRTAWRPIRVGECALCGQKPVSLLTDTSQGTKGTFINVTPAVQVASEPARSDDEPWLEELALLAEVSFL